MTAKQLAAVAASFAFAAPGLAFDTNPIGPTTTTMFYVSVPLDYGPRHKVSYGVQFQGRHEDHAVRLDSTMLNFTGGGVEGKWVVAGGVALLAALAVGRKDKSTTANLQAQQTQQEQTGGGGCTHKPVDPCAK